MLKKSWNFWYIIMYTWEEFFLIHCIIFITRLGQSHYLFLSMFKIETRCSNFVTPTYNPKYYTPAKKAWKFVMMGASWEILTFDCQHFSSGWLYWLTVIWYGTLLSFLLGDLYSQAHLFCPSQYRMTRMVLAWPQLSPRAGTRRESSPGLNFVVIWLVKTIWKA